ncbi:MAG: diguanylate cyclase [Candidatus Sericytochromatia bacterium]
MNLISKNNFFTLYNLKNFRNINDFYGLIEGDNILKLTSSELKKQINIDLYRIAGDKFFSLTKSIEPLRKITINNLVSIEVINLEVKKTFLDRKFSNPETFLDFLFEIIYTKENEFFRITDSYIV